MVVVCLDLDVYKRQGVLRVMQHAPEKANGEDGLPIPPYKVYKIGNNSPENLLDFVTILQEELIRAGVLPFDYDFDAHKELVPMQQMCIRDSSIGSELCRQLVQMGIQKLIMFDSAETPLHSQT